MGGAAAASAAVLVASSLSSAPATAGPSGTGLPQEIVNDVKVKNVISHLEAFQRIAHENADTRAAGSPGYEASAEYVHDKLADAGYNVSYQSFDFIYTEELRESLNEISPTERELPV